MPTFYLNKKETENKQYLVHNIDICQNYPPLSEMTYLGVFKSLEHALQHSKHHFKNIIGHECHHTQKEEKNSEPQK